MFMSEKYEHQGKQFTRAVAMELIFKAYVWKPPVDNQTICEEVYQIHKSGGGLPFKSENEDIRVRQVVKRALTELKCNGGATKEQELWHIHERDDENIRSDEQKYPKTLGTGSEEVYLYYYRAYRERAEVRRPPVWKTFQKRRFWECKIGETHDQDTKKRTGQQGREAPEKKVIALIMKTDTSHWLENMIQEILKNWGRHVPHAIGTEWYRTNPSEVEDIYLFLQSNGSGWVIM